VPSSDEASASPFDDNRLLRAISSESERARISAASTVEELTLRAVLFEAGDVIRNVYFPLEGIISMVTVLSDGVGVETAIVGNEGMAGEAVFLGDSLWMNARAVIQMAGRAVVIDAKDFRVLSTELPEFREIMERYMRARIAIAAQDVACNRRHSLEQRCARWLLQTHDRAGTDRFPLTQEFLAQMIGTHRPSVTEVAQKLREAGAITYQRGQLALLDRKKLEGLACECYAVIKSEVERLLPGGR